MLKRWGLLALIFILAVSCAQAQDTPKIAIIIDDLGYDFEIAKLL